MPIKEGSIEIELEIERIVNQIIGIKKLNKHENTKSLENQIDQLVYQLYNLTAEEIDIIENSTK